MNTTGEFSGGENIFLYTQFFQRLKVLDWVDCFRCCWMLIKNIDISEYDRNFHMKIDIYAVKQRAKRKRTAI